MSAGRPDPQQLFTYIRRHSLYMLSIGLTEADPQGWCRLGLQGFAKRFEGNDRNRRQWQRAFDDLVAWGFVESESPGDQTVRHRAFRVTGRGVDFLAMVHRDIGAGLERAGSAVYPFS